MSKFVPHTCPTCTQTTNYVLRLDRGSALIVLAIANAVRRLGRNRVHYEHDMLATADRGHAFAEMISEGYMNPSMARNIVRPRYHGLIAFADRGTGEYLLTRKGADFIHGHAVPCTAIIDKVNGHNVGYYEPDGSVTIGELLRKDAVMWQGALKSPRDYFEVHPELTQTLL